MVKPVTVLIVDDEPGVRESLRATLAGECTVLTAATGDEALAVVRSRRVDVVTLDLRMPGGNGIGILERLKALDPNIEALIISGYGSRDAVETAGTLGAFEFVSKPFDVERVRALVRQAAERRRALTRHVDGRFVSAVAP